MNWEKAPFGRSDYLEFEVLPPKPAKFDEMVKIAKSLSSGHPFLRVDLYEIYAEELLADKYYEGAYIVKDVKAAIYWYEKAANQGSVYAMYQAGYVYYTVPIDYNKAGQWFSLAAEKGNKDAEDVLRNHLRYNRFTKKWDAIR